MVEAFAYIDCQFLMESSIYRGWYFGNHVRDWSAALATCLVLAPLFCNVLGARRLEGDALDVAWTRQFYKEAVVKG
ncbi:conserved hypothetical protein [Ricinus communis]|uniref:Uncharacterized protein n=1 Tax=Ricinus communis TaxID=3988 RepID=B9S0Q3_RICCO|nr:conserved hypothetical protein [Ricinus communis]